MIYSFGDCELDNDRYLLTVGGSARPIEPQVFDVLVYLLVNRGRVVSKEELLDAVWGDRFVSESALTSRIKAARQAVGDDGRRQAVIRTAHGKGYEFVAHVATGPLPDGAAGPAEPDPGAPRRSNQLPAAVSSLVGRDEELDRLRVAFDEARLLTLVGPAGVGKTALCYALARSVQAAFPDGVYVCELAMVTAERAAIEALATGLDVSSRLDTPLDDALVDSLRARACLLVLDNCEHLVGPLSTIVDRILRRSPQVKVLATSREPLAVAGERVWPIEPLPVDIDDESLVRSPAVALFVQRAQAADPRFVLGPDNHDAVAEICRRLDGIPLAIELAAARTRVVGVDEIAGRLDERFRLLKGVRRDVDPRHRALDDAIRWSYDLMTASEQALFNRLSVFAGPFGLDDAEAVCGVGGDDSGLDDATPLDTGADDTDPDDGDRLHAHDDVMELVSRLAERSMVTFRRSISGGTSYEVLETLRAYGRGRLRDRDLVELSRRHMKHYAAFAAQVDDGVRGSDEARIVDRASRSFADLRAAQRSALDMAELDIALGLICALREYSMRSMRYEVLSWADAAGGVEGASEHPLYPTLLGMCAYSRWMRGQFDEAVDLAGRAGALEAAQGLEPSGLAERVLGNVRYVRGDDDGGFEATTRQLELAEASGLPSRVAHAAYMHSIATSLRDREEALRLAAVAEEMARRSQSPTDLASAWVARGFVASDPAAGLAAFETAADAAARGRNRWMRTFALTEAAGRMLELGRLDEACRGLSATVDVWFRAGEWSQQWLTMGRCLVALASIGETELAARLAGAVGERAAIGATPVVANLRSLALDTASDLRERMGDEAYEQLRREGAAMPDVDIVYLTRAALTR